ncbi:hypothetical protein CPB84DRAFT_1717348 [Gymnopilus junonius]|uniref:DUF6534 domain-containing protein n=1 Tax=Gymnopilus junonius TaxID=109634 RepID=A0A9P5N9L2_GYMJU|nr:hypothetical protein CPB84DRAFT_1717348 [Gymnopilus junonius]
MDASFNAHSTLGALLIGIFVSCCLFGVSTVQTYTYYTRFPEDGAWLKFMVMAVWKVLSSYSREMRITLDLLYRFCELAHYICMSQTVYNLAVTNFGNPSALLTLGLSIDVAVFFSAVITTVAQLFFVERLRLLSKSRWIAMACWVLSLARLSLLMAMFAKMVQMSVKQTNAAQILKAIKPLFATVLIGGSTLDFFIALYLGYYMKISKPKVYFWSTSVMIDTVAMWSIETGLLTGITELVFLITFFALPDTWIWEAVFCSLVFSNTLLASLNGRRRFRSSNKSYINDLDGGKVPSQPAQVSKFKLNDFTLMTTVGSLSRPYIRLRSRLTK